MKISVLGGRRQFADFLRSIPECEVAEFQSFGKLLSHAEKDFQKAIFILPDTVSILSLFILSAVT